MIAPFPVRVCPKLTGRVQPVRTSPDADVKSEYRISLRLRSLRSRPARDSRQAGQAKLETTWTSASETVWNSSILNPQCAIAVLREATEIHDETAGHTL